MEDIISVEKIAVIANGSIDDYGLIKDILQDYDQFFAVDGGLNHCPNLEVQPTLLIGDMDSVDPMVQKEYPNLGTMTFQRDKNATDLELAIEFLVEKKPKSITIFSGIGDRIDHSITNLILITRYPGKVFLETEREIIGAIKDTLELTTTPGQTLSLIPLNGPVCGINSSGLKWELQDGTLDKNFVGISNEVVDSSICISVESGDLVYSLHKIKE